MPQDVIRGPAFDVVGVASSAGGLTALIELLGGIDARFPAAMAVVQHLDPRHRSLLAQILQKRTGLTVLEAINGAPLRPGVVQIAPPDHHLLVNSDGTVSLTQSELVHFTRPSADLLFESMAAAYGARAIAVVLTGTGTDGAMGVSAMKKRGGTVIVQDEASSEHFGMPSAAIRTGVVDFVLPLGEIPAALQVLVAGSAD